MRIAQKVKTLAAESEDMSSIMGSAWWKKISTSWKLSPNFHMHVMICVMHTLSHMHTHASTLDNFLKY